LNSRYVGPFKVIDPPASEKTNHGPSKNFVWLALPITLGEIRQPLDLSRLRRFVERPAYLGGTPPKLPALGLSEKWGRHCGDSIEGVSASVLAEFCIGHDLSLTLPRYDFPSDHYMHPFKGPRPVRIYDTWTEQGRLQACLYLLDMPLPVNDDGLEFETVAVDVFPAKRTRAGENWSLLRALHYSFPGLTHLKDLLPNADKSVVYRNTLLPIHTLVATHLSRGRDPIRELLV